MNKTDKIKSIKWNDSYTHNLFDKIKDRSNLTHNQILDKIRLGLDKTIDSLDSNDYCLYFDKSKFILLSNYNKELNTVYVITILSYYMKTKGCVKLSVNKVSNIGYSKFNSIHENDNSVTIINKYMIIEPDSDHNDETSSLYINPIILNF